LTQAERATKDKATMKHRVDELERVESERLRRIEAAMEVLLSREFQFTRFTLIQGCKPPAT
jgi:hypothetical protein